MDTLQITTSETEIRVQSGKSHSYNQTEKLLEPES